MDLLPQRLRAEFIADELIADRIRLDFVVMDAEGFVAVGTPLSHRSKRRYVHGLLLEEQDVTPDGSVSRPLRL
jgi:hypothetical protein